MALTAIQDPTNITLEEAHDFLVKLIHEHLKVNKLRELGSQNGYDILITIIVDKSLPQLQQYPPMPASIDGKIKTKVYRAFQDAAWELCLAGLLRPSPFDTGYNASGEGYSITEIGFKWFASDEIDRSVQSTHMIGRLLDQYSDQFGKAYQKKSQEAVKNYQARTFISCCSMCGAAAEAIVLALAIEKSQDREQTRAEYYTGHGRSRIINKVFGGLTDGAKAQYRAGIDLVNAYRDECSHGDDTDIDKDSDTARTMLDTLMRFARLCHQHWDNLTGKGSA
jgi:hypothetical protein